MLEVYGLVALRNAGLHRRNWYDAETIEERDRARWSGLTDFLSAFRLHLPAAKTAPCPEWTGRAPELTGKLAG